MYQRGDTGNCSQHREMIFAWNFRFFFFTAPSINWVVQTVKSGHVTPKIPAYAGLQRQKKKRTQSSSLPPTHPRPRMRHGGSHVAGECPCSAYADDMLMKPSDLVLLMLCCCAEGGKSSADQLPMLLRRSVCCVCVCVSFASPRTHPAACALLPRSAVGVGGWGG